MNRKLEKGDVVLAVLPEQIPSMHEQQVLFDINPIVYPNVAAGAGNLKQDSVVLLDKVRAIDGRRLLQYIGRLNEEEYAPIKAGLSRIFT